MSKGDVKNPSTDGRVKGNNPKSSGRGGNTTPENQHTKGRGPSKSQSSPGRGGNTKPENQHTRNS